MSNSAITHDRRHRDIQGGWHTLSLLWGNWKRRRKVRGLRDLDDRILDDIGVTREEIAWAAELPLTINPALALQDRAGRRRRSGVLARIKSKG